MQGTGNIVIGAMLVLTGLAIMLDRAGVFQWRDRWTLWPLILGGIGVARFLQSKPGEPKQGLLFLTAAVWLLLGETGWLSLEDSWPIFLIAFGLIVALNGGETATVATAGYAWRTGDPPQAQTAAPSRPSVVSARHARHLDRHHRRPAGVRHVRSFSEANVGKRVRVVSVMGRSEHTSRPTAFQGADVTNVMGRSELDLHDAMLAPGAKRP